MDGVGTAAQLGVALVPEGAPEPVRRGLARHRGGDVEDVPGLAVLPAADAVPRVHPADRFQRLDERGAVQVGLPDQAVQYSFEDGDLRLLGGEQGGQLLGQLGRRGDRGTQRARLGDGREGLVPPGVRIVVVPAADRRAEQLAGPAVVNGVQRLGREPQLRQHRLPRRRQVTGHHVERPLLDARVRGPEGLGRC